MANYIFEDMTSADITSFNGANDTLSFRTGTANNVAVTYTTTVTPGDATHPAATVHAAVLTDSADGVSQTFSGVSNLPIAHGVFVDGTSLYVGGTAGDGPATATRAFGGDGNDTLTGTGTGFFLQGNQGADSLTGGVGGGIIYGGADNDTIHVVGSGTSTATHNLVNGNAGDDTIVSTNVAGDTLYGGQGQDNITGAGNDLVNGNAGNDVILGAGGNNTLYGGQDNDSISTSGANDLINGNAGNDTIHDTGATGQATIHGGQGNDLITVDGAAGSHGALVFGDLGDDTIISTGGFNDTLSGGDGNDSISATSLVAGTAYSIDGGAGVNTISVVHSGVSSGNDTITAGDGVGGVGNTIDLTVVGAGNDQIVTGLGNDIINVHGAGTGSDTINAGAGNNTISIDPAHTGGESILSGAGADTITGGAGNDTINSGEGNDHITLQTTAGHVAHVTVGAGHDTITGGAGQTVLTKTQAGASLFDVANHQQYLTQGAQDQVIGWNGAGDQLHFGLHTAGGPATPVFINDPALTVTDYATAITEAGNQFAHYNVVALQVGTDVVVFADVNGSGHLEAGDTAVVLVGRSLADIHASNITG
jgi:Ca2+-binding RTX toxin-like protein